MGTKFASGVLAVVVTLVARPGHAELPALDRAAAAEERIVAAKGVTNADFTIPGGGACSDKLCLFTWLQTGIASTPNDVFAIRARRDGTPLDAAGLRLGAGNGLNRDHLESQVIWNGQYFAVFWKTGSGLLRFRRVSPDGALLDAAALDIATSLTTDSSYGNAFTAAWTGSDFLVVWNGLGWHGMHFKDNGLAAAPIVHLAGIDGAKVRASLWTGTNFMFVTVGVRSAVLVTLDTAGNLLRSTKFSSELTPFGCESAALARSVSGVALVWSTLEVDRRTLHTLVVGPEGQLDPGSAVEIGTTAFVAPNYGWRTRIGIAGETGLFLFIRGLDYSTRATVMGRRFSLDGTGWLDAEAFAVSTVEETALYDIELVDAGSEWVPLWSDYFTTLKRGICSGRLPATGSPGAPACRLIAFNSATPVDPELWASADGYLVRWRMQETGFKSGSEARFARFTDAGAPRDADWFHLPFGSPYPIGGGPTPVILHQEFDPGTSRVGPFAAWNLIAPPGPGDSTTTNLLLADQAFPFAGVWTGDRYLTVFGWSRAGVGGNEAVGRFLLPDATPDAPASIPSRFPINTPPATSIGESFAMGSNGTQQLLMWYRSENVNQVFALDRNGAVIESFELRWDMTVSPPTPCVGIAGIAPDGDGFLVACGRAIADKPDYAVRLIGYRAGTPVRFLGDFALPDRTTIPVVSVIGDAVSVLSTAGSSVAHTLLRRSGDTFSATSSTVKFDFPVASPRLASIDGQTAAFVYLRGAGDETRLAMRILEPGPIPADPTDPDAGANSPLADAGPPDTTNAANLGGGGGCSCNLAERPPLGGGIWLAALGAALLLRRRTSG